MYVCMYVCMYPYVYSMLIVIINNGVQDNMCVFLFVTNRNSYWINEYISFSWRVYILEL